MGSRAHQHRPDQPPGGLTQHSYYPQLAGRARDLVDAGLTAAQIASRLNTEGFRPRLTPISASPVPTPATAVPAGRRRR